MARITASIPEPTDIYSPENQRQVLQALETIKTQLNTSFQKDLKDDLETFSWFIFSGPTE